MFKSVLLTILLSTLVACGGSDPSTPENSNDDRVVDSGNNDSDSGDDNADSTGIPMTALDAARLLNQATYGATLSEIEDITGQTREQWIDAQLALPASYHLPLIEPFSEREEFWRNYRVAAWFNRALYADDQLRQRVAFALSEIFVVSEFNGVLFDSPMAVTHYYDLLVEHAFSDYRTLLEAVTLSPAMGVYLSMLGNEKPDLERNIRPDENYAREVMQLFSIGLVELNLDGSVKLDSENQPIPTYGQDEIKGFAHVFTGWHFNGTAENTWYYWWDNMDLFEPMSAVQAFHDENEKQLFPGVLLPAEQTAELNLEQALDALANHSNVPAFISKQLIQKLVTSNPSPDYVQRISQVFEDNGSGERGNLGDVVRAILTDEEAVEGHINAPQSFGKIREPILKATHMWRAFEMHTDGEIIDMGWPEYFFNQAPLASPSVFNFYRPDYSPPTLKNETGLLAPELQIVTDAAVTRTTNFLAWFGLWRAFTGDFSDLEEDDRQSMWIDVSEYVALAESSPSEMIAALNLVLTANTLSEEAMLILEEEYQAMTWAEDKDKVANLIFLIMASPQYAVQR